MRTRTLLHEIQPTIVLQDENGGKKEFHLDRCIDRGASCLVYHAVCADNTEHLLKEHYPKHLYLERGEDGTILVPREKQEEFSSGLVRFKNTSERQKEVRLNEDLKNYTCNVQGFYRGNGTVYLDTTCFAGRVYNDVQEKTLYDLARRMKALTRVLGYYHQKNLLHLDIKPDNILVRPEEETVEDVMLFDFDSVTEFDIVKEGCSLSFTREWAAPEQKLPRRYKEICRGTDIYAIGEIIFVQIFGRHSEESERRSFSRYTFDYEAGIFKGVNPRVFPLLETLLKKTLCGRVEKRYQTADELGQQLEAIIRLADPKEPFIGKELPAVQDFFVGRETELGEIHHLLNENRALFLCGIGGIGKSELAKQYANQYQDSYDSVLFVPYLSDVNAMILDDHTARIRNFGPYPEEEPEEYRARKLRKLGELCDHRTLLIVDNLNRTDDPGLNCKLLVTTRADFSGFGYGKQLPVETLRRSEDINKIFNHHYHGELEERDNAVIREIISLVEGHTMTVELVAKQIDAQWATPGEILEKLKSAGLYGIGEEEVDSGKDNAFSSRSAYGHIKVLFDLSVFGAPEKENELYLLHNLCLMPYTGIDKRLFAQWCELEKHGGKGVVNRLIKNGWVRESHQMISLHPVVAEVVLASLKEDPQAELPVLDHSIRYIKSEEYAEMDAFRRVEVGGILLAMSGNMMRLHRNQEETAGFLNSATNGYWKFGHLDEAIDYIKTALEIYYQLYGDTHDDVARSYNNLGTLYLNQGGMEEAEEYLRKALEIQLKLYGEENGNVSICYNNLGTLYRKQGRMEEAEEYLRKALKIRLKLYGEEHGDLATCYNNLGTLYRKQGRMEEAEEYLRKALKIRLKLYGEEHGDLASSYNNLGTLYQDQGRLDQAEEYLRKALEIRLKLYEEEHDDVAYSYNNLGMLYQDQGRLDQAKEYLRKALEIQLKLYGEEHGDTATCYNNLGRLYQDQGRLDQAEEYLRKALEIQLKLYGEEHGDVADCYNNLGKLYQQQSRVDQAEEYLQKALEIRLKLYGEEHGDVANCYNILGILYQDQSKWNLAEEYLRKALEILMKLYGEETDDVATTYSGLGLLYYYKNELGLAEEYGQKALIVCTKIKGKEHPNTIALEKFMAQIYKKAEQKKCGNKFQKFAAKLLGKRPL